MQARCKHDATALHASQTLLTGLRNSGSVSKRSQKGRLKSKVREGSIQILPILGCLQVLSPKYRNLG